MKSRGFTYKEDYGGYRIESRTLKKESGRAYLVQARATQEEKTTLLVRTEVRQFDVAVDTDLISRVEEQLSGQLKSALDAGAFGRDRF